MLIVPRKYTKKVTSIETWESFGGSIQSVSVLSFSTSTKFTSQETTQAKSNEKLNNVGFFVNVKSFSSQKDMTYLTKTPYFSLRCPAIAHHQRVPKARVVIYKVMLLTKMVRRISSFSSRWTSRDWWFQIRLENDNFKLQNLRIKARLARNIVIVKYGVSSGWKVSNIFKTVFCQNR